MAEMQTAVAWRPWSPSDDEPWNLRRVVHLHHRAGFGATWDELQRDLRDGPRAAVDRLLSGQSRSDGVPSDFEQLAELIGRAAVGSNNPSRLKAWWLYRMLYSPDPLTEKLTLMWHNHFATSNLKVRNSQLMRAQNETLRRRARGPFGELLDAMLHDPALLIWLDAPANQKGNPNENLARELMELFTLGIGHYDEQDVKAGAKALTGWAVEKGRFRNDEQQHDGGEKVILGQRGKWRGDDYLRLLLESPATSRRIAWRLCDLFMGEGVVSDEALEQLAEGLREHELDVGWAVEKILRSEEFLAENNLAARVSQPVEFILGAVRATESFAPPPSTLLLAEWCTRLGQDLFYPPNVGGWTGGRDWLSSHTIVARANFAAALVAGHLHTPRPAPHLETMCRRHAGGVQLDEAVRFFDQLLLGERLDNAERLRIVNALEATPRTQEERTCLAAAMLLAMPEAQLN